MYYLRGKLNSFNSNNYDVKSLILIGPKNSGKTRETINYALKNIKEERCIYYTSSNKNNLIERISSIGTSENWQQPNNLFIYEAPKINYNSSSIEDKNLMHILLGIFKPIENIKPNKIVLDEITPFLNFSDLDLLEKVSKKISLFLNYYKIKALFTLSEPVSQRAKLISEIVKKEFSESYYLT